MIRPQWHGSPFSGEGARLYGGRWNMKGWPALYLAADHVTAVAEYYRGLPRPGALVPSTQNRGGRNLVLWRLHDASEPNGEGAALTMLDPDAALRRSV